jgi:hypothetical protein
MKPALHLLLLLAPAIGFSQNESTHVDLDRIAQVKVRSLVANKMSDDNTLPYSILEPTYKKGQSLKGYYYLESDYFYKENLNEVWKIYNTTSPAEAWNGRMISFGLLVSKWKDYNLYSNDKNYTGIDTGQVFFVNLKVLGGLYNLAVGLEIINVDSVNKSITYSYLKGGKSRGKQTLYFIPTKNGHTEIVHKTAFTGDSFIRERYIYPIFHRKLIDEFHKNMKKSLCMYFDSLAKTPN